ncbi:MAG TPA: hypothetical protein VFW98_14160, partial [Gemmatimonadaceae bacterium]|nr:hypothetical protein [Gemmatimonadaceae bacterium]
VRTASIGSSSLPAIKAYLTGEQFYRRSEWDSAAAYYRVAIAADSTFAPALRHLNDVLGWTLPTDQGERDDRYRYALLAGQMNHGLAPRESLLVAADSMFAALQMNFGHEGPLVFSRAGRLLSTLEDGSRRFPHDPEVWFKLGEARYHNLVFASGVTYASAREAFDRAIALDSMFSPSYIHMPDLELRAQDPQAAAHYSRAYLALQPQGAQAEYLRALLAFLDAKSPAAVPVDSIVRHISFQALTNLSATLFTWMDPSESQVLLARALPEYVRASSDPRAAGINVRFLLAQALATRGHLTEAAALVDSTTLSIIPELARLGVIPANRADHLMDVAVRGGFVNPAFLFRWWADRGDTAALRRMATHFDTMRGASLPAAYLTAVRAAVHGHLDLARHDTAAALHDFVAVPDSICVFDDCVISWFTKAQLLEAHHRDREAMSILRNDIPGNYYELLGPGLVLWHLERARVAERLGDAKTERSDYAFVAAAWQHADSSLQPAVAEARAALRRLSPDAPRRP